MRFYHPDGHVASEGPMLNGRPEGVWRNYYPDGTLKSVGRRRNHLLDSAWTFYTEQGVLAEVVNYREEKRNGERKVFDEEGNLLRKEIYNNDVRSRRIEIFYPSGKIREMIPIDTVGKGKEHGTGYQFAEDDGRVVAVIEYSNGYVRSAERINEKDKFNQEQGLWRMFYPDFKVKSEGRYKNGQKHGYWKEYDQMGNLVETVKYEMGILVEDPEELVKLDIKRTYHPNAQVKSVGSYSKGVEEGVHRQFSEDGKVKSAVIYRKGRVIGDGIVDPEGRRQGEWKEYYETGELRAKGTYRNNRREGEWVFYYRDGKVEQYGNYVKGLADGEWKWVHPNGNVWREEIFYEGKEEGLAIEYNDTGMVVAKGTYVDGEREGEWLINVGEHREEGEYRLGRRNGVWKFYFRNEKLKYEGKFVDGREEGVHRTNYENGSVKLLARYKFGDAEGDWVYYNEEGQVVRVETYARGKVVKVDGVSISGEMKDAVK